MLKKIKGFFKNKREVGKSSETNEASLDKAVISPILNQTVGMFKEIYSYPESFDISVRQLYLKCKQKHAVLFYINTITNQYVLETNVIRPLLSHEYETTQIENIISNKSVKQQSKIEDILLAINNGSGALFIDGSPTAYIVDVSEFKERNIEKTENEIVLKGPKESFIEGVETNISLIRRKIRDENLVIQSQKISKRANNDVYILYIKNLTDNQLVQEVKNRLNQLEVSMIQNLSILEQYIEDRPLSLFSSTLYTERPDWATSHLEKGHVVLLMNNSPSALILPVTFWSFFHTAEDDYLRLINANFIRFIRLVALFLTLFISSIYISVTEYHTELIPTDLLLAIAATRERVPFSPIFEILLMEIAFELIREAGLRVPTPIGPTIGIVGALILGQAAVEANIVSPIVVTIVALAGLSSFVVGNISLNFIIRLLRFAFIIAAASFGMYGVISILMIILFYSTTFKSFGVPFYAPVTPESQSSKDNLFRRVLKNQLFRPGYLNPQDMKKKQGD